MDALERGPALPDARPASNDVRPEITGYALSEDDEGVGWTHSPLPEGFDGEEQGATSAANAPAALASGPSSMPAWTRSSRTSGPPAATASSASPGTRILLPGKPNLMNLPKLPRHGLRHPGESRDDERSHIQTATPRHPC